MTVQVRLLHCHSYTDSTSSIFRLLEGVLPAMSKSTQVLVKPNLVSNTNAGLSCTHPKVVEAACLFLRDCGARIQVGDSPAFGTAAHVASRSGLLPLMKRLDISVRTLDDPVPVQLPSGMRAKVSKTALESDFILNITKLKAHNQMRVTAGVKNLFGCVPGLRKALKHFSLGDRQALFPAYLVDVMQILPPAPTLVDAIVSMHVSGPLKGIPFSSGFLGSCSSPVALDSCICSTLGLSPTDVPLWNECRARALPGVSSSEIRYPLISPEELNLSGFQLPETLSPQRFNLLRIFSSAARRIWKIAAGRMRFPE